MARKYTRRIHSYFAVFDPISKGGYNVTFPDFPGCITFGRNFEEAKGKAKEVLELWLEELRSTKAQIPSGRRHPIIDEVQVLVPQR